MTEETEMQGLTNRIHSSFSNEEYAMIKEIAGSEIMKLAPFVRKCVIWYCKYRKIEQQINKG